MFMYLIIIVSFVPLVSGFPTNRNDKKTKRKKSKTTVICWIFTLFLFYTFLKTIIFAHLYGKITNVLFLMYRGVA